MRAAGAELRLRTAVDRVEKGTDGFQLALTSGVAVSCRSLVVATGGKSIPKMGATGFGYDLAGRFGLPIVETRPALVPLTFETGLLERLKPLAGVAVEDSVVAAGKTRFAEAMLFTHRGLSGPAILQISSYWREGQEIVVDMAPGADVAETLKAARRTRGKQAVLTVLSERLPRRLAQLIVDQAQAAGNVGDLSDKKISLLAAAINGWRVKPVGSEGYRTAEVTLGGVDTRALDSKTLQARDVPGLYFIGEVVDVTGWLGGYNFQWAWSSGWVAGQAA
jgi:predicted Rossmann fold flavoprotein